MPRTVATDPATKAEALRIAAEHGAAEASRQIGVPASTIRMWKARGVGAAKVTDLAEVSTDEVRRRIRELEKTADLGIAELQSAMKGSRSPQSVAISVGVCLTKASELAAAVRELEDREVRLEQGQAQRLVEVVRLFLAELGVPPTDSIKAFMADLFAGRMTASSLPHPDLAQAARTDLREKSATSSRPSAKRSPLGNHQNPTSLKGPRRRNCVMRF